MISGVSNYGDEVFFFNGGVADLGCGCHNGFFIYCAAERKIRF